MKIWEAGVLDENTDAKPGTIVKVEKDSFSVQTGDGLLKVLALQIPGKKRMERTLSYAVIRSKQDVNFLHK